ncbi:MAG: PEP-CTERM sorting domain-containing protein [Planctomycetales bacterium]|nr:PEP-CTERM sorting domain-containing protein [Planctomycetales bacterium]
MNRLLSLASWSLCFALLIAPAQVLAINPASWNLSESTTGGDVFWTSPTAVDVGLPRYFSTYEITRVEAYTIFGGTDVTDQIGATGGSGYTESIPVTLINEALNEPTTGTAATVLVEIDASGYGQLAITDVTLGTLVVLSIPIQITQIDVDATVTIQGIVPGDFDTNLEVNALDFSTWETAFGVSDAADTNFDGVSDAADFLEWQQFFGSDYSPLSAEFVTVPEPATAAGFAFGALLILGAFTDRRKQGTISDFRRTV